MIHCEGTAILKNDKFNFIPISSNKGEYFIIESELEVHFIIKKGILVLPLGNKKYWVGATYNRDNDEEVITSKGEEYLIKKMDGLFNLPYKILKKGFGFRPTIKDRRPVLGEHPDYNNEFVFNGLGTKGVSLAPFYSEMLTKYIYQYGQIEKEVDIQRFLNA